MEEMWKNSAIIAKRNVDDNGTPFSIQLSELKQVIEVHSCIVLNQLPDISQSIFIEGFTEVVDIENLTNRNYKVDYANGVVYFHPVNIGKTLAIEYRGIGYCLLSASRIYTKYDKQGNILETLEELIDRGKLYIKAIETLGGAVEVINKLDQDIVEGDKLHNELVEDILVGNEVKDELVAKTEIANTTINTLVEKTNTGNQTVTQLIDKSNIANQKKQALDDSITRATNANEVLTNTNQSATQTNLTLQQTIATGQDSINTINATGNKSLVIGGSQFVNNEYTWTHSMNNDNLIVNLMDSISNEPLMQDYRIIDKNNILIRNSVEHPNIKVVLSASYYQGNSLFGTNVEEFADDSVGVNEKSVRLKDDNGLYKNPVTNSDSVFLMDGKTKLTKKIDNIDIHLNQIALRISQFDKQIPESDDTKRFQRAINYLTLGGTLLINEDITVSSHIDFIDDVSIICSKSINIITTKDIATSGNFQGQLFRVDGKKNVHLLNINLDGKDFTCGLVSFSNSSNCSVEFCTIKNSPTSQAIMITDSKNINIENNYIYRMFHGVQLWNSKNCNIYQNIIDVATGGIWHAVCYNCNYYNNTVSNCEDVGIDMEGGRNCSAYDNVVTRCKNGELAIFKDAVGDMSVGCSNLIFHDNTVIAENEYTKYDGLTSVCTNGAIYINSISENSKGIVFRNNTFNLKNRHAIFTDELVDISNSGIEIIDNIFDIYTDTAPCVVNGLKGGFIKDNSFNFYVDNTKTGEFKNCQNTLIDNNMFNYINGKSTGYSTLLYTDRDIENFKYSRNKFINCDYPLKADAYNNTKVNSIFIIDNDLGEKALETGGLYITANNKVKLINQKLRVKLNVTSGSVDLSTIPCFNRKQNDYNSADFEGVLKIMFGFDKKNSYKLGYYGGRLYSYNGSGNPSGTSNQDYLYATFNGSVISFNAYNIYDYNETYLDCIANT